MPVNSSKHKTNYVIGWLVGSLVAWLLGQFGLTQFGSIRTIMLVDLQVWLWGQFWWICKCPLGQCWWICKFGCGDNFGGFASAH